MGKDKVYHFIAGAILFIIGGMWLTIIGGAAKEIYDYRHRDKHNADLFDFIATIIGGCFICFILLLKGI